MKRFVVGVLAILLALGPSVAGAQAATPTSAAATHDTASTKAFIALQERYDIAAIRSAPAINAAERAFAAQVRGGCPGVLADLPKQLTQRQGKAVSNFLSESFLALDIDVFAPLRRVVDRIVAQQRRLRFSDPALQWQVQMNGAANAAYFALRPPNLCTDGRLLASSGFTRITTAGGRFVREGLTLDVWAAAAPSSFVQKMRSYAPAAAAIALKRLPELQRVLDRTIPIGNQLDAMLRVLGLRHRTTINLARLGVTS